MASSPDSVFRKKPFVIAGSLIFLIICAYAPALNGPLVFDDHVNITENRKVAIHDLSLSSLKSALLSNSSGPLKRPLPALSFGINHYLAGGFKQTFPFKATNLAIHVLNALLVFWLAYLLWPRLFVSNEPIGRQKRNTIAGFTALAWSLHPIHTTAVAYVVQRMASMSATFVFLGLCLFVIGRERFEQKAAAGLSLMWTGVVGGTLLSLLCKEDGALLPVYAGVIEFTLFGALGKKAGKTPHTHYLCPESSAIIPSQGTETVFGRIKNNLILSFKKLRSPLADRDKPCRRLFYFYLLTLILPVLAALVYWFVYPGKLVDGYAARPFTLTQRLLTEARVLWLYLYMLFVPDIKLMGLFHDDVPVSTGWLTPWSTLLALLSWSVTVPLAIWARKHIPLVSFAILWYLAGHSLTSTFIPLVLVFEHRNYVPAFGMTLLFINGIFYFYGRFFSGTKLQPALLCSGVIAGLFLGTLSRSENWSTEKRLIASLANNHPKSAKSQYLYGEMLYYKYNNTSQGYRYYEKAVRLKPDELGILIKLALLEPAEDLSNPNHRQPGILFDPRRIGWLLKNRPVSAWGLKALDIAGRCALAKHHSCLDHRQFVITWFNALLRNPRLTLSQRRYFTIRLFDLEMKYELYDEALATVTRAKSKDLSFSDYYLMYAYVLAVTGRYSMSFNVLNQVDYQFARFNPKLKTKVDRMRINIRTMALHKR
ncbi:MAG: hypothetical protein ACU84H_17510 [Gammaproteobacteria bacterium]